MFKKCSIDFDRMNSKYIKIWDEKTETLWNHNVSEKQMVENSKFLYIMAMSIESLFKKLLIGLNTRTNERF